MKKILIKEKCKHRWRVLRQTKREEIIEGKAYSHTEGNATKVTIPIISQKSEVITEEFCELCGQMRAKLKKI